MSAVRRRPRGGTVRYSNLAEAEASPLQARATKSVRYADNTVCRIPTPRAESGRKGAHHRRLGAATETSQRRGGGNGTVSSSSASAAAAAAAVDGHTASNNSHITNAAATASPSPRGANAPATGGGATDAAVTSSPGSHSHRHRHHHHRLGGKHLQRQRRHRSGSKHGKSPADAQAASLRPRPSGDELSLTSSSSCGSGGGGSDDDDETPTASSSSSATSQSGGGGGGGRRRTEPNALPQLLSAPTPPEAPPGPFPAPSPRTLGGISAASNNASASHNAHDTLAPGGAAHAPSRLRPTPPSTNRASPDVSLLVVGGGSTPRPRGGSGDDGGVPALASSANHPARPGCDNDSASVRTADSSGARGGGAPPNGTPAPLTSFRRRTLELARPATTPDAGDGLESTPEADGAERRPVTGGGGGTSQGQQQQQQRHFIVRPGRSPRGFSDSAAAATAVDAGTVAYLASTVPASPPHEGSIGGGAGGGAAAAAPRVAAPPTGTPGLTPRGRANGSSSSGSTPRRASRETDSGCGARISPAAAEAVAAAGASFVSAGGMCQGWRKTMEDFQVICTVKGTRSAAAAAGGCALLLGDDDDDCTTAHDASVSHSSVCTHASNADAPAVAAEKADTATVAVGCLACIFDGHRGDKAAALAAEQLPKILLRRLGEAPKAVSTDPTPPSARAVELSCLDPLWEQRYHVFVDTFQEVDGLIFAAQGGTDTFPVPQLTLTAADLAAAANGNGNGSGGENGGGRRRGGSGISGRSGGGGGGGGGALPEFSLLQGTPQDSPRPRALSGRSGASGVSHTNNIAAGLERHYARGLSSPSKFAVTGGGGGAGGDVTPRPPPPGRNAFSQAPARGSGDGDGVDALSDAASRNAASGRRRRAPPSSIAPSTTAAAADDVLSSWAELSSCSSLGSAVVGNNNNSSYHKSDNNNNNNSGTTPRSAHSSQRCNNADADQDDDDSNDDSGRHSSPLAAGGFAPVHEELTRGFVSIVPELSEHGSGSPRAYTGLLPLVYNGRAVSLSLPPALQPRESPSMNGAGLLGIAGSGNINNGSGEYSPPRACAATTPSASPTPVELPASAGSTAIVIYADSDSITVANLGDCRAFLVESRPPPPPPPAPASAAGAALTVVPSSAAVRAMSDPLPGVAAAATAAAAAALKGAGDSSGNDGDDGAGSPAAGGRRRARRTVGFSGDSAANEEAAPAASATTRRGGGGGGVTLAAPPVPFHQRLAERYRLPAHLAVSALTEDHRSVTNTGELARLFGIFGETAGKTSAQTRREEEERRRRAEEAEETLLRSGSYLAPVELADLMDLLSASASARGSEDGASNSGSRRGSGSAGPALLPPSLKPFPRVRGKLAVTRALGDFDLKFDLLHLCAPVLAAVYAASASAASVSAPPAGLSITAAELIQQKLPTRKMDWYKRTHPKKSKKDKKGSGGDDDPEGNGADVASNAAASPPSPPSPTSPLNIKSSIPPAPRAPELYFSPFLISNVPEVRTLRRGRLPPPPLPPPPALEPAPEDNDAAAAAAAATATAAEPHCSYDAIIAGCDGLWELQTVEKIGRRLDEVLQPLLAERARILLGGNNNNNINNNSAHGCGSGSSGGDTEEAETVGYSATSGGAGEDGSEVTAPKAHTAAAAAATTTTSNSNGNGGGEGGEDKGALSTDVASARAVSRSSAASSAAAAAAARLSAEDERRMLDARLRLWQMRVETAVRAQVIEVALHEAVAPTCRGGTGATPGADNLSLTISVLLD